MINFSNNSTNLRKIIYGDDIVEAEIEKIIKYDFIMFCDLTNTNIDVFYNAPTQGIIDDLKNYTDIAYTITPKYLLIKSNRTTYLVEFCNKTYYIIEFFSNKDIYDEMKSNFENNKNMLSFVYRIANLRKQIYIKKN